MVVVVVVDGNGSGRGAAAAGSAFVLRFARKISTRLCKYVDP